MPHMPDRFYDPAPSRPIALSLTLRHRCFDRGTRCTLATLALLLLAPLGLFGGTSSFAWGPMLQSIITELTGPTAVLLVILGFVVGGAIFIFSRYENAAMRILMVAIGGGIMVGAAALATALGFSGAVI